MKKYLVTTLLLASVSAFSFAADNPLSVHVLEQSTGQPAPGVEVTLEKKQGDSWEKLKTATTNAQGRVTALYPADTPLPQGQYKVVFKTGAYYEHKKIPTFFPEVPVIFEAQNNGGHYHIPLLLSPFGYATYRGN